MFLYVHTISDEVVSRSLAYPSVQKWFAEDVPYYVKIRLKLIHPLKNADFQLIFARSASAVTLSKKVQLTLIESPLRT